MSRNQSQFLCLTHPGGGAGCSISLSSLRCARPISSNRALLFRLFFGALIVLRVFGLQISRAEEVHAGFIYDRHPLTLEPGIQTEAVGPFYYRTKTEFDQTFALPPVFSHLTSSDTDSEEYDFFYPLLSFDRFGTEYRWHFFQLLSFAGGHNQADDSIRRFTLFPIYFQQRSTDPSLNYTAVFPFYGHLANRIFRSEMDFVCWPIYLKTVKRAAASPLPDDPFAKLGNRYLSARRGDVTTYNYVYPFFHLRYGDGLEGWQLFPLVGHEKKVVTTKTNQWNDLETTPGYEKRFLLWPFYAKEDREIGGDNPEHELVVFPFYQRLRSPQRDSTSYLTPLGLTITDDRARKYHEVDAPWPLIVFARGEGKTANRVWPLFGQAHNADLESSFYLWPLYKFNGIHADTLDRGRTRLLFFFYQHTVDKNLETGKSRSRTDLWPLFVHRRELDGNTRLQVLAPIESILPTSKSMERNYSPLWTIWRAEKNPSTGDSSQSLLWNFYRRESTPTTRKSSLLFGLIQYESNAETKRWRLFYLPLTKSQDRTNHVSEHR